MMMVEKEPARHTLLGDGKILILGDYYYKENNRGKFRFPQKQLWKQILSVYRKVSCNSMSLSTRVGRADTPSLVDLFFTLSKYQILYTIWTRNHVVSEFDNVASDDMEERSERRNDLKRKYNRAEYTEQRKCLGTYNGKRNSTVRIENNVVEGSVKSELKELDQCYPWLYIYIYMNYSKKRCFSKGCQKAKQHRDVPWRRHKWYNSQSASERYKKSRSDYSKIRKRRQNNFERNPCGQGRGKSELFCKS